MNIHEYQAKGLLQRFGVATLRGAVAFSADEAERAARDLGGKLWVVKAQIHAGGRGKAGGVKLAKSTAEVRTLAQAMLGMTLVTKQTGPAGRVVKRLYVESGCDIARELYFGVVVDRTTGKVGIIASPEESGRLASSVADTGGVWVIPALQGLGTPYLDPAARAVVGGISRATTRAHIVRAVLEGVAWRCREVYEALRADCPHPAPAVLRADGGMAGNDVLLQAQADALGIPIERPAVREAAALGAAYLAGLATGVWTDARDLARAWQRDGVFEPKLAADEREGRFAAWQSHVAAARAT